MKGLLFLFFVLLLHTASAQQAGNFPKENYLKIDTTITMRDGIRLYTVIYVPLDRSTTYPILLERTPYGSGPYGKENYAKALGPNPNLMREKYIMVSQDVRGRFMSEGVNLEMTPHLPNKKEKQTDESSDTFDTIEWLLKNISNNNGRVGIYGISYPGFYATASLPNAHPALKAVSPQAPIADEFIGDDVNHNGAFFLMDNFMFMNSYGQTRPGPVKAYNGQRFKIKSKDMYRFFLEMGPVKNTQSPAWFDNKTTIWNEYLQHDSYDDYWKSRNITKHLQNISVPTLVVGGWFDAEDLYGALHTYQAIEKGNPSNKNKLVMGPWAHGTWAAQEWSRFASHDFGTNTSKTFQDSIETSFFNFYLKDKGSFDIAEATIFETGSNKWKPFATWPPKEAEATDYFLNANGKLSRTKESGTTSFTEYTSDPAKPVPYTNGTYSYRNNDYMAEDQRFAATRPDVIVFESGPLTEDLVLAGSITADLRVSITGTDADFIVKLIDVLPDDEPNFKNAPRGFQMAGYQRLVRAEVMRGKFRNSFEKPEPLIPGTITNVKFDLNAVSHCFKKGHRLMVQVQSSWFPLVDRNPQKFMRIPEANEADFRKADIRIYHDTTNASKIILPVLRTP